MPRAARTVKKKPAAAKRRATVARAPKPKRPAPRVAAAAAPTGSPVAPAERRAALAESAERMRERLWAEQGQPLTTVDGVTIAFALLQKGRPHWHLLTFGLALDGLELSLRVLKGKDELAPPSWAVALLSTLIARVRAKELTADTNQVLVLSEGVAPGTDSELKGLIFTIDPDAGKLVTPHDKAPVLLAVPVTRDEIRAVREWSPSGLVEVLLKGDPLLLTDLDRASLLQSPRARAVIDQRIEREGSSLSTITTERSALIAGAKKTTWKLSADAMDSLLSLLKGRTGHQRPFAIRSPELRVDVENAATPGFSVGAGRLSLKLSLVAARALRSLLRASPGRYVVEFLPGLELEVEG